MDRKLVDLRKNEMAIWGKRYNRKADNCEFKVLAKEKHFFLN